MSRRLDMFYAILTLARCETSAIDLRASCKAIVESSELADFAEPPFSASEVESMAAGIYDFVFIPDSGPGQYPDIQFSTVRAGMAMSMNLFRFASLNSEDMRRCCLVESEALIRSRGSDYSCDNIAKADFIGILITLMFRYRSAMANDQHVAASYIWRTAKVGAAIANNDFSVNVICSAIICFLSLYDEFVV